jgi:hypothetical protein
MFRVGSARFLSVPSVSRSRRLLGLSNGSQETRYGGPVDVKRAADMYAQGRTLRQIGAELGVHWSTLSQQLQKAGVTMRRGGPEAHPASTEQILELRDQGLTWNEVAKRSI